jgi:hypothetical protein
MFRAGIAYPKYAVIEGAGVGAVRHCVFSTGEFVEPITEWHAPVRLGFDVSAQPPPLRELSIYGAINTPHLNGYFQSVRGQFELVAGADNTTQLVGTTWYWNKVQPDAYWNVWSRYLVHAIHRRVLNHIKTQAEAQPPR